MVYRRDEGDQVTIFLLTRRHTRDVHARTRVQSSERALLHGSSVITGRCVMISADSLSMVQ